MWYDKYFVWIYIWSWCWKSGANWVSAHEQFLLPISFEKVKLQFFSQPRSLHTRWSVCAAGRQFIPVMIFSQIIDTEFENIRCYYVFVLIRMTNVNFKSTSLHRSRRNTMPMFEFVNKISFKFITAPTWMKWFYVPVFWFCMNLAIFKNKINHDAILYIKW